MNTLSNVPQSSKIVFMLLFISSVLISNRCLSQNFGTEFPFVNGSENSGYRPFSDGFPQTELKPLELSPVIKTRIGEPSLYMLAPTISASEAYVVMSKDRMSGLSFNINLDLEAPFAAAADSQNVKNILDARGNINLELAAKGGVFGGISNDQERAERGAMFGLSGALAVQSSTDSANSTTFTNSFFVANASISAWLSSFYLGLKFERYKMFGKDGQFKDLFESIVDDGVLSFMAVVRFEDVYFQASYVYPLGVDDSDERGLDVGFGLRFTPF